MTRADLTDITLVLDRSGSMESVKAATIEAFNGFLNSQRKGVGSARMTLVQFDNEYEVVFAAQPLDQATELNNQTFQPRGATALLDAMGRTMIATGKRLSDMPEAERPGTVLFVTLTDGEENASHEFDLTKINAMISEQRDKYAWQFVFLAANQDAIATAAKMGIGAAQSLTMSATPAGVQSSLAALDRHTHAARARGVAGAACAPMAFDDSDRRAAQDDTQ
ncbi:MAG: hypothetical protein JWM11_4351 [Planctomycetaceae bacterium]|nr:hypothetical protein [Planctomycetaceae bacterium]